MSILQVIALKYYYQGVGVTRMRTFFSAALLVASMYNNAYAVSGNDLYGRCANYDQSILNNNASCSQRVIDSIMCRMYVFGVIDATQGTLTICPSEDLEYDQVVFIVKKHLSENPDRLDLDANKLVIKALSEAFPCE